MLFLVSSVAVIFCLLILQLPGIQSLCSVDNCDLTYCSGAGCIKCEDGFFIADTTCHECQPFCNKCDNNSSCIECKRGWYGTTCDSECRRECHECTGFTHCTECLPGRFGSFCQFHCPLGCMDILCDKGTGECTEGCRHGYYPNGNDCILCPDHCTRCSNGSHCTGCILGYFGSFCEKPCPYGCEGHHCDKVKGHCMNGCIDGYFADDLDCLECPQTCETCVNSETCVGCKTGYWGPRCENGCPLDCIRCDGQGFCIKDPVCNIDHCARGYCLGDGCIKCNDGFYLTDTSCEECPVYCTECSRPSDCTQCVPGRYGSICDRICRDTCTQCMDFSLCMECIPGRFGSYCQFYCSLGCKDIMCDKVSGECVDGCRHGFYPKEGECASCPEHCNRCSDDLQCTDCASGYYGTYCQNTCHVSCLNKVCHKQLGYCTEGCSNGYFQDGQSCSLCPARCTLCRDKSTCTGCLSGYWGQMCQYECPLDCYVCTVSGQCIYDSECTVSNCDTDYCMENSCIKCDEGYYLTELSCLKCPTDCTECTGQTECTGCVSGRYGVTCEATCRDTCLECTSSSQCTRCIPGRYGQYCELYCPLGCVDIACDKTTGRCLQGCRHGYYLSGSDCNECPEHCARCSDSDYCTTCYSGYYGNDCTASCSSRCQNRLCDKQLGTCTDGCVDGYYLDEDVCVGCPVRCEACSGQSVCTRCKTGYWGPQCQENCESTCLRCSTDGQCISDPICLIDNCERGYCLDRSCINCIDGFYLSDTHCLQCPSSCKKCSGPTTCTDCVQGRYGSECEYTCINVCKDCTSASHCTQCIPGRHGAFCQLYCPLGCADILCEKESGKCIKGCRRGYYNSQDDCVECPIHCTACSASDFCTSCSAGYYGRGCQHSCPSSCLDHKCDKRFGNCTEGCRDGYYYNDNNCIECPERCESCFDESTCTACKEGFWGNQCQDYCPTECRKCTEEGECSEDGDLICNIDHCSKDYCLGSGCIKCEDGYYLSGTHCHQCQQYCTKCSGHSACSECERGRFGPECEYTCNYPCLECTSSLHCTDCIPGRHGERCHLNCPLGCKSIRCNVNTGGCTDGCRRGFYMQEESCVPCPHHCSDCSDSNVCSACNPGYYGANCQMSCPHGCQDQLCYKETGQCSGGCIEGYYYNEICLKCPDSCLSCIDESSCRECKPRYWGSYCQNHCSEDCYRCTNAMQCSDDTGPPCYIDNCDKDYCFGSGCIRCENGFYLDGIGCSQCPINCKECSSSSQCEVCIKGQYGSSCDVACPAPCIDCESNDQCTECSYGRYGSACQLYCPIGCKDIICDQSSGQCTNGCSNGFYLSGDSCVSCPDHCIACNNGSYCTDCSAGFYGRTCELSCHEGCMDQLCFIDSGNCSHGCSVDYQYQHGYCIKDEDYTECEVPFCEPGNCFGNACTLCEHGYYVEEFQCLECPNYCTSCANGNQCNNCTLGRYGSFCQHQCSSGCRKDTCNKEFGFCTEGCLEGYTMSGGDCLPCPNNCVSCNFIHTCTECDFGFWGNICQYSCIGCSSIGCQQDINCTDGCEAGYYVQEIGDQYDCIPCPEGCSTCTDKATCNTCIPGYWGRSCNESCNQFCNQHMCDKDSGNCTKGCKNGYYGPTCIWQCSTNCETCTNEQSCTTCVSGRFGAICGEICNTGCFRNICSKDNGTCIHGCAVGYYGDTCDEDIGSSSCSTKEDNGASIALGVLLALSGIVISVLVYILFRGKEPEVEQTPAIMNQAYDKHIEKSDLFHPMKERSSSYDNSKINASSDGDKTASTNNKIYRYPSSKREDFDENYDEEAEYSIIRSSNDNITKFNP